MTGWPESLLGPVEDVAPRLLGAVLTHAGVAVRVTEVEAYAGPDDPASHAHRGRTPRTAVMFGPPGRLYVYFSYGMHWCANVVTGRDGTASAVLLRGGEVVAGDDQARERRGPGVPEAALARGPANLARALGLDRDADGLDLAALLHLADPPPTTYSRGPRVGVSRAADLTWRFWLPDEPTVSAYRRSPRAES